MFDSEFIHDNISDTRMVLGVGGVSRWMTAARALSPRWKLSWRGGSCGSGFTCWGGGRPGGSATPRLTATLCRMAQAQMILQTSGRGAYHPTHPGSTNGLLGARLRLNDATRTGMDLIILGFLATLWVRDGN